jgi:hypothetical protein
MGPDTITLVITLCIWLLLLTFTTVILSLSR